MKRGAGYLAPAIGMLLVLLAQGCKSGSGGAGGQDAVRQHSPSAGARGAETGKPARETIRIGVFGSLTGSTATFGVSTKNGIELGAGEINARGGVLGKPIELVVEDDRGLTTEAATVVTRLINQHRVVAVLGEVASKLSMTVAPICQRSQVPMITPASTNPSVTQAGDYVFRICFIDPFQGTVMARFAYHTLKVRRVAVLMDVAQDYSKGLAEFFRQEIQRLGAKVVADDSFSSGDTDFRAQLTKIAAAKPDAVFIPAYYTEAGLIARQAREVGIKAPLLGGDGWDSPELVRIGGAAVENTYFSNHYSVEDRSPRVQEFVRKYQAKYHDLPDAMAALGYDAIRILCDAITRAGTTQSQALRDAIAATANFPGVTGNITLDKERNARKSAVVLQVKQGKFHFVQTVQP